MEAISEASGSSQHSFLRNGFREHETRDIAFWLTDPGSLNTAGLALSPRDHAKFSQLLLDARPGSKRGRIPDFN